MDNKENGFRYTYCAKEQAEVESIRKKYLPAETDKLEQLRKLDSGVTQKANACAIAVGIIGALIMGTGMSLAMTDLGKMLGMNDSFAMLIGVVIGVIGISLVALTYPIYNRVLKKERQRIAPEILRLTDELLKQETKT